MIDGSNIHKSHLKPLRSEFHHLISKGTAGQGIQKLLDDYSFNSVLDIGSGQGLHTQIFRKYGKDVTAVDLGESVYVRRADSDVEFLKCDFMNTHFEKSFDCIWCSHVLEHQLNVNSFLKQIHSNLSEGGVLAITVPPLKHEIVGGHLSVWNAGLVIYNLVMAGFNCKKVSVLKYGYNISCIVVKESVKMPLELTFDSGDIEKLSQFFPEELKEGFNGDIYELNWYAHR